MSSILVRIPNLDGSRVQRTSLFLAFHPAILQHCLLPLKLIIYRSMLVGVDCDEFTEMALKSPSMKAPADPVLVRAVSRQP